MPSERLASASSGLLAYGLVCCVGFVVYCNSLSAGFVYDDSRAILKNRDLLPTTPLANLLYNDFWGTPLQHSGSHRSYRPLCVLSFRLNYAVSRLESAFSYHLANVLLHCVVCMLYLHVCRIMLPASNQGLWTALVAALLFAVHPIHTEAVSGLVGRADVGSALFFLLAFICYSHFSRSVAARNHGAGIWWYCGVVISTAAAMLSKEIGITVLGVSFAYDVLVNERIQLASILDVVKKVNLIIRWGSLLMVGVVLLLWRISVMGGSPPSFSSSDNPAANENSTLTRFLTFSHLPALNMLLMVFPRSLSFDWSMGSVPLLESASDGRNLITLVFYLSLAMLSWKVLSSLNDRYIQTSLWSLLVLSIPFLPASNLFFYVGFVLAERVLYIPSMGFCILVAVGVQRLYGKAKSNAVKLLLSVAVAMVLLTFGARTWQRNQDWHDEESLYRSGIPYNPPKAWSNLANILKAKGDLLGAENAYRNALSHRGNMADAHYNLGVLLQDRGDMKGADSSYRNAISFRPTLAFAHLNLGIVLRSLKQDGEAEKVFRHCVTIPDTGLKDPAAHAHAVTSCWFTLGQLQRDQKRYQEALEVLKRALHHAPPAYELQGVHNLLGSTYEFLGDARMADSHFKKSLSIKSDHLPALVGYAKFLADQKRLAEAEKVYLSAPAGATSLQAYYGVFLCNQEDRRGEGALLMEKAFVDGERSPDLLSALADCYRRNKNYAKSIAKYKSAAEMRPDANAYSNLGAVYHLSGDYGNAERAYQHALALNPNFKTAKENLEKLQNSKKRR